MAGADPISRLFSLEQFGIKLGLENVTRLCEAFGHPERRFTTIHVAGTNGKGSTVALMRAMLEDAVSPMPPKPVYQRC